MDLPTVLETTLESLEPLPRTKAAARRIDALNRLETELLTLQPFIDLYNKGYCRWAINPSQMRAFVSQTQLMQTRIEAERQAVRLSCSTDIQETREVVLRQLIRLFEKTLASKTTMRLPSEGPVISAGLQIRSTQGPCWSLCNTSALSTVDGTGCPNPLNSRSPAESTTLPGPDFDDALHTIIKVAPVPRAATTSHVPKKTALPNEEILCEHLVLSLPAGQEERESQSLTIRWQ
jgi:hypothetical protein